MYGDDGVTWREPELVPTPETSIMRPYRNCSYCGSIHPQDLLEFTKREKFVNYKTVYPEVMQHPHMEVADMKYGYPHKIYVTSKVVLFPDHDFVSSTDGKGNVLSRHKGCTPFIKFYTKHLDDPKVSEADFNEVTAMLEELAGIDFTRDAGGLKWRRAQPKIPTTPN